MGAKVIVESEVADKPIGVQDGHALCYLKLVNVGPDTLNATNNCPLPSIAVAPGHLIFGTPDELRQALHDIVDRAMNARFGEE